MEVRLLRKHFLIFSCFLLFLFLFVGCSTGKNEGESEAVKAGAAESTEEEEQNNLEEQPEEEEQESEEEQDEETVKQEEVQGEDDSVTEVEQEGEGLSLGDYEIYLGGEMVETEDKIIINGESNLLPGARVVGEVSVGDDQYFADTTELVKDDGTFYMEIAHHNLKEETRVTVKFHFDSPQDNGIIRHYGDRGQKLTGPYIYKHQRAAGGRSPKDIYQKAEVSATFAPGEEKSIRHFQEPSWYEIPEDLGDTRVWIEVDDINNDQEYFYLHGRSNLLEGSKIRGSYHYKNDETLVLPDGSFDLKIEYEYRENTPFIIEFKPHDFQWNLVEEVYGKEGQNLVGDLVVTNKYNNKQTIEKIVELESNEINVPDNVELTIEGTEVTMLVPDNLLFDFDKYELKGASKETLMGIIETLETFNKKLDIVINGHTDNVGDKQYNLELSEKRAEEVKAFFEKNGDLKNLNFTTKGYGETKPIASNDDETGQAKNRRVEIVINLK